MSWKNLVTISRLSLALSCLVISAVAEKPAAKNVVQQQAAAKVAYSRLPLIFEANQGQAAAPVKYLSHGGGYSLFITQDEAVFVFSGKDPQVLRMKLAGAGQAQGMEKLAGTTDYFLGNDPAKWVTNVPQFGKVALKSVRPGVDLYYYGNSGRLEYDYVIAPGADAKAVGLEANGAKRLRVDANGDLVITLANGEVTFQKPLAYQEQNGKRTLVAAEYRLDGNRIHFKLGNYDRTQPLTIDPVFNYLTYLGGTNSAAATAVALDSSALAYVAGNTMATSFPVKTNDCTTPATCGVLGSQDVFVARLSANGETIQKLSIIGGSGTDSAVSIAVGTGSPATAYVGGNTSSTDFPVVNAFQGTLGGGAGQDGFVFALPSAGTALSYSTYIGGTSSDSVFGVKFTSNRLYVVGDTSSSGLFSTSPATQFQALTGASDAYIAKFDPSVSGTAGLLYATYFGGGAADSGKGIAVPSADTVYIVGTTTSNDLFTSTLSSTPISATLSGAFDAFVTKFDTRVFDVSSTLCVAGGTKKITVTLGTTPSPALQIGEWVVLSGLGASASITAAQYNTRHKITDVSGATFKYSEPVCAGGANGETAGITAGTSKAAASVLHSTYIGGSGTEDGLGIAVDNAGRQYIVGTTDSPNAAAFPDDTNPIQATGFGGGTTDAFIAQLSAGGTSLGYSAYLGGAGADVAKAVAVDPGCSATCDAWVAGSTQSTLTTVFNDVTAFGAGSGTPDLSGGQDAFVVRVNGNGNGLLFGSYIGGSGVGTVEAINGVALNASTSSLYVAGQTDSSNLPVTAAAAQNLPPFSSTGFVARISAGNGSDSGLSFTNHPPSADPLLSGNSVTYTWDVNSANGALNPTFDLVMPNDGAGNDFITVTSATPNCAIRVGSATNGPGGVTCQLANMGVAGTQLVTINGTLNAAIAACVTQPCASFTMTPKAASVEVEGPGNPKTDPTATTGHVGQSVTLDVTGTTANSNVSGGASYKDTVDTSITFNLKVSNPAADATDVNINIAMVYPNNFVVDTPDPGCTDSPGTHTVTCNVGIVNGGGGTASKNVIGHYTTVAAPATLTHFLTATPATASTTQVFVTDGTKNSNVSFPVSYLGPTADLAITSLTVLPSPVNEGATVTVKADYVNNGPDPATSTLTLTLSPAAVANGPLPGGCVQAANIVTCTLGSLANGATGSRTITLPAPLATTSASAPFQVTAAIASSDTQEPGCCTANNSSVQSTTVERHTNLSLGTLTAPASVSQNGTITYTLPINNPASPNTAQNVVVRFTVSNAGTFGLSGFTVATNCSLSAPNIDCTVDNITTAGKTITVTITPDATLLGTTFAFKTVSTTANIQSASSIDANGAFPFAATPAANTDVQRRTDLNLSAFTVLPNPTSQTGNIVVHVQVDNAAGTDTAQHVSLHYVLPANYNFVNISLGSCVTNVAAGTADCDIGAVTTGSPANVNFTLTPPANFVLVTSSSATLNAQITSVSSTAVVDGATGTKSTIVGSTVVERRSNLGVSAFSVSPTPNANDGQQLTYTVNGGNVSGDTAEGVKFTIDFTSAGASGFTLGTTTPPGVCSITTPTQVTCTVGQVVVGAGGNFSYSVPINPPAGFLAGSASKAWKADATISGNVVDSTPANNSITNVTTNIQAQADLTLQMVANNSSGTNISTSNLKTVFSYLFDVSEQATVSGGGSPTPATNARVTFTLPNSSGRTFTASSINSGNFVCTVGGVAPVFPIAPGTTVVCVLSTTLTPGGASEQFEIVGDPAFGGGVVLPALQKTNTLPANATLDTVGPTVAETNAADNTANAPVILNRVADMNIGTIVATPGQPPVPPGTAYIEGTDPFSILNIPIFNSGPDDISAANQVNLVSVAMPVGTTFNAANSDPSCSFAALVVTCTNVVVPAGGNISLNVAITPPSQSSANANFTTTWNLNTGAGAGTYNDGNSANNNANSTVVIQRQGNIAVSIAPVIPGVGYVVAGPNFSQKIVYDVTVSATSPGANASNVPVSIVLPSGSSGLTSNIVGPNSCTPASNTMNCTIVTLNAGTSVNFQVSGLPLLSITQPDDPGVTATVSINPNSLNLVDQNATDDSATSAGIPLRGETDVQLVVTSPPTPVPNRGRPLNAVAAGDDLTYTLTVTALGTAGMHPAKNLTVDQVLPPNTTLNSVTSAFFTCPGNTMPCTLTQLSQNNPATITISIHVPETAVPTQPSNLLYQVFSTAFNQPSIAANDTETAGNNNNNNLTPTGAGSFSSVAEQTSDMAVTVPNPGLLQPGNTAHFMITVTNVGSLNGATGTSVVIPLNASPVSNSSVAVGTPSQGSCNALTNGGTASASVTCNLGAIAVGANATIDLAVTPALPGQVQITPTVSVTNVDPNSANDSATATLLTGNTPAGSPVTINPAHPTSGVTNNEITVTFNTVAPPGGNTTAISYAAIPAAPPTPPSGYHYVNSPLGVQLAYNMNTTATYAGFPTLMCFNVGGPLTKPERVRVFSGNTDITVSTNFSMAAGGGVVCADANLASLNALNGTMPVEVVEPTNNPPTAAATNQSSSTSGKGLTGAGVTLFANPGSSDDSSACFATINGAPVTTCSDLDFALLTWTGQFTDGNVKQVQCTGPGGPTNLAANPPQKPAGGGAGGCLQLDVSVPFGQQTVTLQITDPYGATSNLASTAINSTASAGGSTSGSVTVNAGQAASYSVNATGGGGTTTISIMGISPATNTITCSVTPSSFTGTGTPSLSVGCSTQAPVFASREPLPLPMSNDDGNVQLAGAIGITALPLFGMLLLPGRNRRSKRTKVLALLGLVLLMTLFMGACGGGGSGSNFGGSATLQSAGTPKGTYTITLGATGGTFDCPGSCSSTKTLTLVVQ